MRAITKCSIVTRNNAPCQFHPASPHKQSIIKFHNYNTFVTFKQYLKVATVPRSFSPAISTLPSTTQLRQNYEKNDCHALFSGRGAEHRLHGGEKPTHQKEQETDVALIGGGIEAPRWEPICRLQPDWSAMTMVERLDGVAQESSKRLE